MLTTSPDLSSGAIDAVNAGAGNAVTLSVTNSDIKPWQYMRLRERSRSRGRRSSLASKRWLLTKIH